MGSMTPSSRRDLDFWSWESASRQVAQGEDSVLANFEERQNRSRERAGTSYAEG